MGGSTKKVETTPQQTQDVRKQLIDYLMGGGSANGGAMGGLNRVGAQAGYQPGQVGVQQAGDVNTQFGGGVEINRNLIRDVQAGGGVSQQVGTQFDPGMVNTSFQGGGLGPQARAQQVQGQFAPTVGAPQQARDVAAGSTQSVDQLGGANSSFMQNILQQTQPLFDQQRSMALAQAKEQSGNLTGSGYANALGNSLNRLVPQQQAQLAQYATQALGLEQQRQQQDASRGLQAQGMNQGADQTLMNQLLQYGQLGQGAQALGLQGQGMNQQAGLQASGLNQQAYRDMAGRGLQAQQLGLQGQTANQQAGLQAQQLGLQGQGMNQQAQQADYARQLQAALANQGMDANFINQLLASRGQDLQGQQLGLQAQGMNQQNQQQGYNLRAQLEAARQGQMGQTDAARQAQNASIFAQLLGGQATAGVAPSEVVKSGGIGAILGPLAQGIGGYMGAGGNPLGFLGGLFGGGGGGAVAQGNQLFSSNPQRFGSFF